MASFDLACLVWPSVVVYIWPCMAFLWSLMAEYRFFLAVIDPNSFGLVYTNPKLYFTWEWLHVPVWCGLYHSAFRSFDLTLHLKKSQKNFIIFVDITINKFVVNIQLDINVFVQKVRTGREGIKMAFLCRLFSITWLMTPHVIRSRPLCIL